MGGRAPRRRQPGRAPPRLARLAVLLCAALVAGPARAAVPHLVVTTADGEVLADAPLPGDGRWRLEWRR